MIVINVVIGKFRGEVLRWLAHVTVWLQVSDYRQLSNYNFADWLEQNTAVYTPITLEEIIIVMITTSNEKKRGPKLRFIAPIWSTY